MADIDDIDTKKTLADTETEILTLVLMLLHCLVGFDL